MSNLLFVDFETNEGAVDRQLTDVWCVGLAAGDDEPFIVTENIVETIQSFIDAGYVPVFHNASFDLWVAESLGVTGIHNFHDTMLIHYLVAPTETHSLASLGEKLGYPKLESTPFNEGYTEQMGTYCKRDVVICREVFNTYYSYLKAVKPLLSLYFSVELPLVRCIIDMECNGVMVDADHWREVIGLLESQSDELHEQLADVPNQLGKKSTTKRMRPPEQISNGDKRELGKWCQLGQSETEYKWAMWEPFNPASPVHVKNVLGLDKSDKEALEECDNPLAKLILDIRRVDKLLTTYGETMLAKVQPDGRLHGSYNQTVTLTGRLSSSNPNLQNIPSRGESGDALRKLFIAPPGRKLVSIDLDQFQLRVYAWYLANQVDNEEYPDALALWEDFNNNPNADPHQAKADLMNVPRSVAKTLNFATLFGASPAKAAATAGTTLAEMKAFFKQQEELFPSDKALKEEVISACRRNNGVVFSLYGRRGWYPDVNEQDWGLKGRAERQAFNFIIQGTEADIVKMIIIEARHRLLGKADLIMTVHDELTFECDEGVANEVASVLNSVVNEVPWLLGLKVSGTASIGGSWYDVH